MNTSPPLYQVGLFNDIHTYFPAMLYEPERFGSVHELLNYIRRQIRVHSDPYIRGVDGYAASQQAPQTPPPPRRQVPAPPGLHRAPTMPVSMVFEQRIPASRATNTMDILTSDMIRGLLGTTLLGAMNDFGGVPPPQQTMEPVVVRPTPAQISAASTISIVEADDNICAICQDTIAAGTEARTLHVCDHSFHTLCIDTWFSRHVNCPVCRHDIRETANE